MLYGPYYILVEIWNLLTPMVLFHVLWATFVGTVVGHAARPHRDHGHCPARPASPSACPPSTPSSS